MLSSYNKTKDMEMRDLTLDALEIAVRRGSVFAHVLAEHSKRFAEKIATHNYQEEDARTSRVDAIIKKFYAPHK